MSRLQSFGAHDLSARIGMGSLDDVLRAMVRKRERAVVTRRALRRPCVDGGAGGEGRRAARPPRALERTARGAGGGGPVVSSANHGVPGRDGGTACAGRPEPGHRGAIKGRCGRLALDDRLRMMATVERSFERTHAADGAWPIVERDARDQREIAACAASTLAGAALKALAKLPEQRYAAAEQIHAELPGLAREEGLLIDVARVARSMRDRFPGSRGERRRMS